MLWLTRPPYLRWAAAVALVGAALVAELGPRPTTSHPFALLDLPAGAEVAEDDVTWREVPAGLLPDVSLPLRTGTPVAAGEPLLPSQSSSRPAIPAGWWALQMTVPSGTAPGQEVRVVVAPDGPDGGTVEVPGVVVAETPGDGYGPPPVLVAVPEERAALVAVAAGEGRVTVLVGG